MSASTDRGTHLWLLMAVNSGDSDELEMSPYEESAWSDLGDFWQRKAERRSLLLRPLRVLLHTLVRPAKRTSRRDV